MLCDDLEGWEGGPRGRGYMYVFPVVQLLKNLPANAGDFGLVNFHMPQGN